MSGEHWFEELADPVHFVDDPTLAWGFYGHRLDLYRRTVPHDGFRVLREWGARVFTSNVDGQFQRAGFTDVLVTGMLTRWTSVRARPIASGAKLLSALRPVTPRTTSTKKNVITTSVRKHAPQL